MILSSQENPFVKIRTRWFPLWMFGGLFVIVILLGIFQSTASNDRALWGQLFGVLLYGLIALWIYRAVKRSGLNIRDLLKKSEGLGRVRLGGLVVALLVFSMCALLVTYAALSHIWPKLLIFLMKPDEVSRSPRLRAVNSVLDAVSLVVLAPVLEEILFRGILLNRWAEKWGLRGAVIFSSIAFGILHADPMGAFVFGVCMSLLYIKTGTLRYSMAAHALNNLAVLALTLIPREKGPATAQDALQDYRSFPWVAIIVLFAITPFILGFVRHNWPGKSDFSPYKKDWLRTVIANPFGESESARYQPPETVA